MSLYNRSIGLVLTFSTALLTSIAMLITNEYISKLETRFTKLRDWIKIITLLYEKTLETSMVEKIDAKEKRNWKKNLHSLLW